jgi:hypothetical protein
MRVDPVAVLLFFASLAAGVFYISHTAPEKRTVYVFPTPDNVDELQFTDLSKTCFKYEAQRVGCPKDPNQIANYQVQGA